MVIGDDVDIGANTTIDRGALADTVIEDGVKLDNQIQIGHNCHIGAHTAMAGCVGVAGSAMIGKYCTFGGAAMVLGPPDDRRPRAYLLGQHGLALDPRGRASTPASTRWPRTPSGKKSAAIVRNLATMREKIRALEKTIAILNDQNKNEQLKRQSP